VKPPEGRYHLPSSREAALGARGLRDGSEHESGRSIGIHRIVGDGPEPFRVPSSEGCRARDSADGGRGREDEHSLARGCRVASRLDEPLDIPAPIATGEELTEASLSHLLEDIGRLGDAPEEQHVEVGWQASEKRLEVLFTHFTVGRATTVPPSVVNALGA